MTLKEWAKEYPKIAASLFNCPVNDLDNILEDMSDEDVDISGYLTREQTDKIIEMILNL